MPDNNPHNEAELLQRIAQGDEKAFAIVFSDHFRQMCYYAVEIVANRHAAEDLVVETFVKLHQKKPQFESSAKLKSYLFSVLHNAAIDYIKADKRHESAHQKLTTTTNQYQENAELAMVKAEALNELHKEIALLPPQCSQVIYKLFIEEKTVKEIANEMGLAYQTVLNQKTRGISLLRSSLLKNNLLSPLLLFYILSLLD